MIPNAFSGRRPSTAAESSSVPLAGDGRARLAGVDGLRAFAALWVVLFHIRAVTGAHLPPILDIIVRSGSTGVSLFLVLSGFCLYLPVAGSGVRQFDSRRFFARRCRRLLPTYYVTVAIFLALTVAAAGHLGFGQISAPDAAIQGATHVTLTQQFFAPTFYGINGSYWSLGLECELYLTFPLLLLAARRFGVYRTVAGVVAVNAGYRLVLALIISLGALPSSGVFTTDVLPNLFVGRWGEFALGMLAADLFQRGELPRLKRRLVLVIAVSGAAGLALVGSPVAHLLFGATFFGLLGLVITGRNSVAKLFSWPPLVSIGAMSFSLYLVHQPILQIEDALLGSGAGSDPTMMFLELVALLPVVLIAAGLLFVLVERRAFTQKALNEIPGWSFVETRLPKWSRSATVTST